MKYKRLLFFLIGMIGMIFIMNDTRRSLKYTKDITPNGIVDLELAYDTAKTAAIIDAWKNTIIERKSNIEKARINTYWDFLFIFFYSAFLFLMCRWIAPMYKQPVKKIGIFLASACLFAGLLDVFENMGMLQTLEGRSSGGITLFTAIFASIKFIILLLAAVYVVIAGGIAACKKNFG